MEDESVKPLIMPLAVAHLKNAEGQLSGAVASLQLPMNKMWNKDIAWMFSGKKGEADYLDLDISNPKDPVFFVLCNNQSEAAALSPALATVLSIVMTNINQKGKHHVLFQADEVPTLFIKGLHLLPATARSNKVAVDLYIQGIAQLVLEYGEKQTRALMASMGSQFYGMLSDEKRAHTISNMLGTVQKVQTSYGKSTGGTSENESYQDKKVLQARELMEMRTGQFVTKVADGDPAFCQSMFDYFDHEDPSIFPVYYSKVKTETPADWITGDEEYDKNLLEVLKEENFERINRESRELLSESIEFVDAQREDEE